MIADILSVVLKALAYLTLLQAAGGALYQATDGSRLEHSTRGVRALIMRSAVACIAFTALHVTMEAGRMSGEMSGVFDGHLQRVAWQSALGAAASLRILGMALVAVYGLREIGPTAVGRTIGAVTAMASLTLVGHTSTHPDRWMLAPLLLFHLLVAAWWFGSLIPLAMAVRKESPVHARALVDRFSAIAVWLAPGLALAGVLMAVVITKGRYSTTDSYDLALTGKAFGFALLMGLAALNRWRLGPGVSTGGARAVHAFRFSVAIEFVVMSGVVVLTAVMTSLFSPEQI